MIPLFKTHFSIGESLLTPRKCFELAEGLEEVVFVEDSFSGFRKIENLSEEFEKPFRWGIKLNCRHGDNNASSINLFAKNNEGLIELRKIYSEAYTKNDGVWDYDKDRLDNILLCLPFYDSYVHKSLHNFGIYDLPVSDNIHFVENHGHPYDYQIKRALDKLKVKTETVHTVLYNKDKNFKEFQFYKSTCNRSGGRPPSVGKPELQDCGCDNFSWESYVSV